MQERIMQIIAETLGELPEKIIPSARLEEDLGCDSLDVLETIITLECEFEVEIPDEQWASLRTVQDVIDAIARTRQ